LLSLFIDEDSMRRGVERGLRADGIDVLTVTQAGRRGLPDEEQLAFASAQGRTIYTSNARDYARLHDAWLSSGRGHAGIIVLPRQNTSVGAQLRALRALCLAHDSMSMQNQIEYLSNWLSS